MNSCYAKVNSAPFIWGPYQGGDPRLDKLIQNTIESCKHYGADKVRIAAFEQMKGNDALADVGLDAYKDNRDDFLHISNIAFDCMTDEERHIEFCKNHHITPWLY